MEIYAIGHSNYSLDKFLDMINEYDISCIVDIRETPYSKYNVQYNKESFNETLKKKGYTYIYMGDEFGARRKSKLSYNKLGYADFEQVAKENIFLQGIERLKKGCEMGYKIVLMGAMQDPIRCHRSILVGRELVKKGFNVKYIMHEGHIEYQNNIEEQLLDKYFDERNQLSIDNLLGKAMDKTDMLNECYKKANKEIGYRTENLK